MTYLLRRIRVRRPALMILLAMAGGVVGCHEDENARVAKVAQQAADRQAKQNEEMVRLNREVAEGTAHEICTRCDEGRSCFCNRGTRDEAQAPTRLLRLF